ncbi:MAG: hypothetical protein ACKOGA_02425 [Planctomycetaceae bacterium]
MRICWLVGVLLAAGGLVAGERARGAAPEAKELAEKVIKRAGGEGKLLKLFRFRERVLITDKPAPAVKEDEPGNRTSVVEVGGDWWVNQAKRDKDKVRVLCWGWSLRVLLAPQSRVEVLPSGPIAGQPAVGLRVTGSIKEPLDLWFDGESHRMVAMDYDDTRHMFSEWKETAEGRAYPAHVVGFRFRDRATKQLQDKQWYQTDLLEVVELSELPADLKR